MHPAQLSSVKDRRQTIPHFLPPCSFSLSTAPFRAPNLSSVIRIASSTCLPLMPALSRRFPISLAPKTCCLLSAPGAYIASSPTRSSSQSHNSLSSLRQISSYATARSAFPENPIPLLEPEDQEAKNQLYTSSVNRTAITTWEVKKGRSRETKGSRGPRRGSKRPQLGSLTATAATRCSLAAPSSVTSLRPFLLPLRPAAPVLATLVETAAVRAAVMSLTYWV